MAYRRTPFAPGEWYHCFTRGVDKRTIFETTQDYSRFTELLYLSNSTLTIERGDIKRLSHDEVFSVPRGNQFVGVGAYSLMSNHPHIFLKEKIEGGITKFLHKVFTGYTMYFNIKRERVGNLLVTPFRSKHVPDDRYAKKVVQYVHINSAEIFEPQWKKGGTRDLHALEKKILAYPYSSAPDYFLPDQRPERAILDSESMELFGKLPSLSETLADLDAYYKELNAELGKRAKS